MLLYIHVPFCDSKCGYCAFNSRTAPHTWHEPYFKALAKQLAHCLKHFSPTLSSVFIGGGTPSLVDSSYYIPLFELFTPYLKPHAEISIEANPNHLSSSFASTLKALGINRISLGAQSFYLPKLQWLERNHDPSNVFASVAMLHQLGFNNINLDLIYNTPFDTDEHLAFEITQLKNLPITHVCAYSLMIEEGSAFYSAHKQELKADSSKDHRIYQLITDLGFKQYEVSNYAKEGYTCKHNLGYWQHKPYLGIGAGAVGFINNKRHTFIQDIHQYIENPFCKNTEILQDSELKLERLFLGLRSSYVGVTKHHITNVSNLQIALDEGIIYEKEGKVYASNLFLADEIALFLSEN